MSQVDRKKAVDELFAKHGDRATADLLVSEASNPKHLLHDEFDWNDKTCAHKARVDRARDIIRSVQVVVTIEDVKVPAIAYVRDPYADARKQGYVAVSAIGRRTEEARLVVSSELDRIEAAISRGRGLAHVLGLSTYFEAVLQTILEIREKLATARVKKASAKKKVS